VVKSRIRAAACALLSAALAAGGCALRSQQQSEVHSAVSPGATLEMRQQQVGNAYRKLQDARYDRKLAEQDYLNTKAAHERTTREFDAASKAYTEARAREKAAEAEYERGLRSVDEVAGSGAKAEPRTR
jgi:hypothetical protein